MRAALNNFGKPRAAEQIPEPVSPLPPASPPPPQIDGPFPTSEEMETSRKAKKRSRAEAEPEMPILDEVPRKRKIVQEGSGLSFDPTDSDNE